MIDAVIIAGHSYFIAKDLVKKLLTVDPKQRLTADGVLKHAWLGVRHYSLFMIYDSRFTNFNDR